MSVQADKTLDLRGLPCPMPVVNMNKGIKEVEIGQVVEALTTDPGATTDFPAWAKTSGNEIVETVEVSGGITFYIKRIK